MIITSQMIRDKLFFKGPMGMTELHCEFGNDGVAINNAIQSGIDKGYIFEKVIFGGKHNITLFYTRWTDEQS